MQPADTRPSHALPRHWLRVGIALVIVLVLHALAAFWLMRNRDAFTPPAPAEVPIQIELLKPQPIERQPAPPAPKPVEPPAAPRRRPRRPPHRNPRLSRSSRRRKRPSTASRRPPRPPRVVCPPHRASMPRRLPAPPAPRLRPATNGVKFNAPPSGDLQYDTFYNGMQNMIGTIHWRTDGHTYDLSVSMPVPFVGPFTYRSEGRIDAFGVAPERYVEKRGKRPEDIAIFNRESAGRVHAHAEQRAAARRRAGPLQHADAAVEAVRGDPSAYKPGVTQQFFVIDNNSGEAWPITVIGDEQVQTQAGIIGARHFMRLPRRDGDTRRIDMWLAPSLGWLPARLVQTEPNGAQIELLWHGRLAAPSAPADEAPAGGATPAPAGTPTPDASTAPATEPAQPAPPATVQPPAQPAAPPAPSPVTSPVTQ